MTVNFNLHLYFLTNRILTDRRYNFSQLYNYAKAEDHCSFCNHHTIIHFHNTTPHFMFYCDIASLPSYIQVFIAWLLSHPRGIRT